MVKNGLIGYKERPWIKREKRSERTEGRKVKEKGKSFRRRSLDIKVVQM